MQREPEDRSAREYGNFASTQWSQVFAAAHSSSPGARQALETSFDMPIEVEQEEYAGHRRHTGDPWRFQKQEFN